MVASLGHEFDFLVLTSDRDLGSHIPYSGIEPGSWQTVGSAQVMYLPTREKALWRWRRWLRRLNYEVIYLNGCFPNSTIKTLLLRWLGCIPRTPTVLAPRGEFSPGALSLKATKKSIYLALTRQLGFYESIVWQASSKHEKADIVNALGVNKKQIIIAPNLVEETLSSNASQAPKRPGSLRAVFLSRITRKKNLHYALEIMSSLRSDIVFDIYGPAEDTTYWQECQSLITKMPANVQVTYHGELDHAKVTDQLSRYHLFLLPTRGENFGHVISEALRAGCPALISDQTPWQELELEMAGWVVPLSQPERYRAVLNAVSDMDHTTWREWSHGARTYGEQAALDPAAVDANRNLFLTAFRQTNRGDDR